MSNTATERLYNLLPAIYRIRDVEQGEPLRALLGIIESQFNALEEDITNLYDNWFIETCDEWAISYIGDLLGTRSLHGVGNGAFSLRSYVGNSLAYRQRKGTAAVVEQLAHDVTGWSARVVEFFTLLAATQHLEHVRLGNVRLDLRRNNKMQLVGTPFEEATYSVDVHRIATKRGRYNIPNIGIFLWRLIAYPVVNAPAVLAAVGEGAHLYRFSQIGHDMALYNRPQAETQIVTLAKEVNVPGALRRRALYEELEARRAALARNEIPATTFFGDQPVFQIWITWSDATTTPVPPERILICDLGDWRRPPVTKDYKAANGTTVPMKIQLSVDPERGRIAFRTNPTHSDNPALTATKVHVSYSYAFSADIGGGAYNRRDTLREAGAGVSVYSVAKNGTYTTMLDAFGAWQNAGKPNAIIEIGDNGIYDTSTGTWSLNPLDNRWLVIQAKDGFRPTLRMTGDLAILDAGPDAPNASITFNGLLIEGGSFAGGNGMIDVMKKLGELNIIHCTLVPGRRLTAAGDAISPTLPSITVDGVNETMKLTIDHSIVGALRLPSTATVVIARDSIIDGVSVAAISAPGGDTQPGPSATLERCTIFGRVTVQELQLGSEVIFNGVLDVKRRQVGCVRFSYLTSGSSTPRRYHCQPDLALVVTGVDPVLTQARLRPEYTSTHYGTPGYGQLSLTCAEELRTGGEDGAEIGVFNLLKQPQREANLRASLDEYMRLGLETGIFFVT